jgi:hypothetical protein
MSDSSEGSPLARMTTDVGEYAAMVVSLRESVALSRMVIEPSPEAATSFSFRDSLTIVSLGPTMVHLQRRKGWCTVRRVYVCYR